jgi:hypothetical protein
MSDNSEKYLFLARKYLFLARQVYQAVEETVPWLAPSRWYQQFRKEVYRNVRRCVAWQQLHHLIKQSLSYIEKKDEYRWTRYSRYPTWLNEMPITFLFLVCSVHRAHQPSKSIIPTRTAHKSIQCIGYFPTSFPALGEMDDKQRSKLRGG